MVRITSKKCMDRTILRTITGKLIKVDTKRKKKRTVKGKACKKAKQNNQRNKLKSDINTEEIKMLCRIASIWILMDNHIQSMKKNKTI